MEREKVSECRIEIRHPNPNSNWKVSECRIEIRHLDGMQNEMIKEIKEYKDKVTSQAGTIGEQKVELRGVREQQENLLTENSALQKAKDAVEKELTDMFKDLESQFNHAKLKSLLIGKDAILLTSSGLTLTLTLSLIGRTPSY